MEEFTEARWADREETMIAATRADRSSMSVPAVVGNRDYRRIVEGEPEWGVAPVQIAPFRRWASMEEARAELVAAVKAEAERRILALMPEWRQRNALAHGLAMMRKVQQGGALSADESVAEAAYQAAWRSVVALRAASDVKELEIAQLADMGAAEAYDPSAGWPA